MAASKRELFSSPFVGKAIYLGGSEEDNALCVCMSSVLYMWLIFASKPIKNEAALDNYG